MRVSILVLYGIYAVSPVYLSAMSGRHDWIVPCGHQDKDISLGIVWVNVLLSKFLPAHQCVQTTTTEMTAAGQDREFILVKKKRAVLRESFSFKPDLVLQTGGSAAAGEPAKPLPLDAASCHPNGRCDDLLAFCRGGLSPPGPFA